MDLPKMREATSYILRITDPMQIPAAVYETRERARHSPLHVLLEHREEPNVIRGVDQPMTESGVLQIKRPDGGLSWYHPGTFCLMWGAPSSNLAVNQMAWGNRVKGLLSSVGYEPPSLEYQDADIYLNNGTPQRRQLVGLSARIGKGFRVHRACWYEADPVPGISHMLRADGIDPRDFSNALAVVEGGLFGYLINNLDSQETDAGSFISGVSMEKARALQTETSGSKVGSCVLGEVKE
jgi:hypothetical protein